MARLLVAALLATLLIVVAGCGSGSLGRNSEPTSTIQPGETIPETTEKAQDAADAANAAIGTQQQQVEDSGVEDEQ